MDTIYYMKYQKAICDALGELPLEKLAEAADLLRSARSGHNRVWIIGNGGSAATAMHLANDLQKMCKIDAYAPPSMVPTITAYGNDNGWDKMYADYLRKTFKNGDILVAISCSGASENVVVAAQEINWRKRLIILTGTITIKNVLAGMDGILIPVFSSDIKIQEDVHMAVCHMLAGVLCEL